MSLEDKRRKRSCSDKHRHMSHEDGFAAWKWWRRKGLTLTLYHCRHCRGWHLGNSRQHAHEHFGAPVAD